jgi:two-component system sensor histidine kinase BaeS
LALGIDLRSSSMRLRLILSFALVALISIFTVVLVARQGAANEVRAFMNRQGTEDSSGLIENLETYYSSQGSWDGAESILLHSRRGQGGQGAGNESSAGKGGQKFILADAQGKVIINTEDSLGGGRLNRTERQSAIPLENDGQVIGYLLASGGAGNDQSGGQHLIDRLNNAALIAALVAGVLAFILAFFLAYRIMRPVKELTRAAEKLGKGDLSQRVQVSGKDELAVLADSFNRMADSLQDSEEKRRSMTSDIAHELRNPLAVQRANLEALQDGIYPLTPENIEPVIEQNALLTRLVEDLRTLAHVDSGHLKLEPVRVNLMDLTRRLVERYQPGIQEKDVSITLKEPGNGVSNCEIYADPLRLEQILANLIDNALRYTPAGGQIVIEVIEKTDRVQLSVHDSGPGIPEEALPYLFDRFYRADRSRSRSKGGTGLGLAIARQLAEAHEGTLTAENHPQGGALFTLTLVNGWQNS